MGNDKLILDGQKLAWHEDRLDAWMNGEHIAPITIDCALTRECTYRCVYCYGTLQENFGKPMTRDVIFRFLDDAAEIGVKAISFVSDGESTCSPYLYAAIKRGKANGLDMALGTNGYLLRLDKLQEILPLLTYLRFNISAADRMRYSEIHGCPQSCFDKVIQTISESVRVKRDFNLGVTIGLQMVLLPQFSDQIIPLADLGKNLGADYLVIKHCSDDEKGQLGVDYSRYFEFTQVLNEAEKKSSEEYLVKAKWSKILSRGERRYSRCYGPSFIMQLSGSGLVAPCGMLFNDRYKRYHIGNITETSFKEIWLSKKYKEVLNLIASDKFDAKTMCGSLCLQHKVNEFLWDLKNGASQIPASVAKPMHVNFV